uniref:C2H2-type domain-containing protein n=1 Tax=viral metagenome TaxID=1070528 RepID=A0A6C0KRK8_9ZZZZ
MDSTFTPNYSQKFHCEFCDFKCSKLNDWKRHASTDKHKNRTNDSTFTPNIKSNVKKQSKIYICECGKKYKYDSGYFRHKKTCKETKEQEITSEKELIMMLLKDNNEFKNIMVEQHKSMMEIMKNGTHNTINSNNKTFNLQLFLNETCKDAINLSDFVNQVKVSINDLEETGKLGYAEGISKVFINNLNDIDFNIRPLHCSDSKREILYIKDNDEWIKDDDQKSFLTNAIKQVANKNIKQISEWQKLYPDYSDPDSKQNDKYMRIVLNSMSGSTKEESNKNYEKIVKNITKEVIIAKS